MNAEKFVKNEAKKMLSGNWHTAILSVLVLLFVPIIPVLILLMAYSLLGEGDSLPQALLESPVTMVLFIVFHLAAVLALVLLIPIYNGFIRIYAGIAEGKAVQPSDLFYFFDEKSRYKNAVKFMTFIIMKSIGILLLCDAVGIGLIMASGGDVHGSFMVFGIILTIVGTITAFCIIHRFGFSVMLFSYFNYDSSNAVVFGAKMAKGNTFKLVRLTATFIPWLLLLFIVVPFIYVYPYMTCSYMISIKYIAQQYTESGNSSQIYTEQNFNADMGATNNYKSDDVTNTNTVTNIPPITENKPKTSHFLQTENLDSEYETNNLELNNAPAQEQKTEYNFENFTEKKNPVSLEKEGTVDKI